MQLKVVDKYRMQKNGLIVYDDDPTHLRVWKPPMRKHWSKELYGKD